MISRYMTALHRTRTLAQTPWPIILRPRHPAPSPTAREHGFPARSRSRTRGLVSWRRSREGARLVLLAALLLELALLLGGRVLVLLVLGDEVVHVGLGLGELHLVHALAGVPVEEG